MEQIQVNPKIYKVPEYTRRAINRYQEKNKEDPRKISNE